MDTLCIIPLIKIALKQPHSKIAQSTFNLISDMADEERASSHNVKNASEQSNYWRSSLAVMKYASQGMAVDHYLSALSNKTSNLNVDLNPYFSNLGGESLDQIEHLMRTAAKKKKSGKKKPSLSLSDHGAIIQDPKAKPSARKRSFAIIFKALGKEGQDLKKAWEDNLKSKKKVKFTTSKGTNVEKEVTLKSISGFSKVKNPSLKNAYMKIWQTQYEGYINSILGLLDNSQDESKQEEAPKSKKMTGDQREKLGEELDNKLGLDEDDIYGIGDDYFDGDKKIEIDGQGIGVVANPREELSSLLDMDVDLTDERTLKFNGVEEDTINLIKHLEDPGRFNLELTGEAYASKDGMDKFKKDSFKKIDEAFKAALENKNEDFDEGKAKKALDGIKEKLSKELDSVSKMMDDEGDDYGRAIGFEYSPDDFSKIKDAYTYDKEND